MAAQTAVVAAKERLTPACRAQLEHGEAGQVQTVVVRTRAQRQVDAEARALLDIVHGEKLATRQTQLLRRVQQHFGHGAEFKRNVAHSRAAAHAKVIAAAPKATSLWLADVVVVSGTKAEIENLARHEDVEAVEENPTFRLPEVLRTPLEDTPQAIDGSAWGLAKIRAPEVWGGYGRGKGVLVGHLDTGVDGTHPALGGRIAAFQEFDGLGNPIASPIHDSDEHGTHTAGTICGRNFRGLNIGVAPEAQLLSALVLPGGSGTYAQIVAGMQWTVEQGANIISMSLGGASYTTLWNLPVLFSTLSGVLVVASIGNSGHGTSGGPGNDILALGVGATHFLDHAAGFSSGQTLLLVPHLIFGAQTYIKPDISAPGVQVVSSIPGPAVAAFNGTSMAAPHVAGAAALVLSSTSSVAGNPMLLRSILLGTVEDFGDAGRDQRFGFGRLDAVSAAQAAVSLP
jgi:subtilisin family serine protease